MQNGRNGHSHAWISDTVIDSILTDPIKVISSVDGSEQSKRGFEWTVQGLLQTDKNTQFTIVHVYDQSKEYLPPRYRHGAVKSSCEALCVSFLLPNRYFFLDRPRLKQIKVGQQLCDIVDEKGAAFMTMGFQGKPDRKDTHIVGSNVMGVMQRGNCSVIIFKTDDPQTLPLQRPTRFVVSVSNNKAATKAFLDALRLSKPGDEIRAVYVRPFGENQINECKMSKDVTTKYAEVIRDLSAPRDTAESALPRFGNRKVELVFAPRGREESIAQALNRYAANWEADFVLVGTNVLRVQRGKPILGSVSLQICMEFQGNLVVSNFREEQQ